MIEFYDSSKCTIRVLLKHFLYISLISGWENNLGNNCMEQVMQIKFVPNPVYRKIKTSMIQNQLFNTVLGNARLYH